MKVIQVCSEANCDNAPTEPIQVGAESHVFCCQKGFEQSLQDFSNKVLRTAKPAKAPGLLIVNSAGHLRDINNPKK